MITPEKAFEIAQAYSIDELAPIAFDCGAGWLFEYGGEEEIDDAWPVIVDKETGLAEEVTFGDKKYDDLWQKIGSLSGIKLNKEETSPTKAAR